MKKRRRRRLLPVRSVIRFKIKSKYGKKYRVANVKRERKLYIVLRSRVCVCFLFSCDSLINKTNIKKQLFIKINKNEKDFV